MVAADGLKLVETVVVGHELDKLCVPKTLSDCLAEGIHRACPQTISPVRSSVSRQRRLDRRNLVWINVTTSPTAKWTARQITEAFPWNEPDEAEAAGWRRALK
jgi:hypothetical protein